MLGTELGAGYVYLNKETWSIAHEAYSLVKKKSLY